MKKTFLSVFSAVWLLLLAGCGTSDSGPAQDTSSQTADIGNNRAAEIALADAGFTEDELSRLYVSRDENNGMVYYEIEFTCQDGSQTEGYYEILASDGSIIKKELNTGAVSASSTDTSEEAVPSGTPEPTPSASPSPSASVSGEPNQNKGSLSYEEARQMALARVPGATDANIELGLDHDDGFVIYEGEIHYNNIEYEFEIDAGTGNFIKWSEDRHD